MTDLIERMIYAYGKELRDDKAMKAAARVMGNELREFAIEHEAEFWNRTPKAMVDAFLKEKGIYANAHKTPLYGSAYKEQEAVQTELKELKEAVAIFFGKSDSGKGWTFSERVNNLTRRAGL